MNTTTTKNFDTLAGRAYKTLHSEIVAGKLKPGVRLVRRSLAKRLNVSPIPVIEALFRLEQDGLVDREPMYGTKVRALTIESVTNDRILREALECQAARQCAENASQEHFCILSIKAEMLDELARKKTDVGLHVFEQQHLDFHLSIANFGNCPSLANEMYRVWFRRLMTLNSLNVQLSGIPANWHGELAEAIAHRDPDLAEAKMREHVRYNTENYRNAIKELMRLKKG